MARYDSGATFDSGIRYDEADQSSPPHKKRMAKVKLNLQKRDDDDLLDFSKTHTAKIATSTDFPGPHKPTAAELDALITDFDTRLQTIASLTVALREAVSAKDDSRTALEGGLNTRGRYIEDESGGAETKILGIGFEVRAVGAPIGDLPAPENLRASFGDNAGENDLVWDRVQGARGYLLQYREVGATDWISVPFQPKSRTTIEGLTSGKNYEFRVRATGTAGEGPWSNVATKMAP